MSRETEEAQRGPHCRSIMNLGPRPRGKGVGQSSACWEVAGWCGEGPPGTHVEGAQDVERGPNAQVVDGAQDERRDEWADAVALGEQGGDGGADENPEEQRDDWGAQHPWGRRQG